MCASLKIIIINTLNAHKNMAMTRLQLIEISLDVSDETKLIDSSPSDQGTLKAQLEIYRLCCSSINQFAAYAYQKQSGIELIGLNY